MSANRTRALPWCAAALTALLCVLWSTAGQAQNTHSEEWSNDQDPIGNQYEPTGRGDLTMDPTLDGLPPVDWYDVRNGYAGVNEENLSPIGDIGYPPPDPGAATPEYGVLSPDSNTSPGYWLPSSWAAGQTSVTFSIDIYADPLIVPNGNSVPDGWWTNGIGPGYVTETGLSWEAFAGGTWTFTTLGGQFFIATVPVGSWYEMETSYFPGSDGTLDATTSLWDATHTVLLGSFTQTTPFLDPINQIIKPAYSWFVYFESNMDMAFVDDFQVSSVPEPSSLVLIAAGLAVVSRRQRRTR